jgi:hypothetical protein
MDSSGHRDGMSLEVITAVLLIAVPVAYVDGSPVAVPANIGIDVSNPSVQAARRSHRHDGASIASGESLAPTSPAEEASMHSSRRPGRGRPGTVCVHRAC